jgi:hypothetical protein
MAKGTIIESVKDALAVGSSLVESATNEIVWLLPPALLVLAAQYSIHDKTRTLIERGGRVQGMFCISSPYVELARSLLDVGQDIRHIDHHEGVFFLVGDKKQSISSLHISPEDISLDDRIVAFWSVDPSYAEYLLSDFESGWRQSVDAREIIKRLTEQSPLKG